VARRERRIGSVRTPWTILVLPGIVAVVGAGFRLAFEEDVPCTTPVRMLDDERAAPEAGRR
jgi:hypothetical protein